MRRIDRRSDLRSGNGELTLQRLLKAYEAVLPKYQVSNPITTWKPIHMVRNTDIEMMELSPMMGSGKAPGGHLLLPVPPQAQPGPGAQLVG